MKPLKFAKPAAMQWDGNKVTDHNRSPVAFSYVRIEDKQRMANGTMRKYVTADKNTFTVSWEQVPDTIENTVDGFWGGREMESFYRSHAGKFDLKLTYGDGRTETYAVMFTDFSKTLEKRGLFDFWNVSAEMEEI